MILNRSKTSSGIISFILGLLVVFAILIYMNQNLLKLVNLLNSLKLVVLVVLEQITIDSTLKSL
jgi:hypothetical protein